ncbi:MAG TPA: CoA transferase [Acidimicrobiales bacterium]|nr:CoA transferase [Acidimicrobiales bacterium]
MTLAGASVVELSAFVAAPLAGMTLAGLGADVIRVDPPGGGLDYHRWPRSRAGDSLFWHGLNRGKRSVVLDWRRDEGRELVAALVARPGPGSGILLTNLGARGTLSHGALRTRREDVISVEIEGYRDGAIAVDYTIAARSGIPFLTGPTGTVGPVNSPLPSWDVATGFCAALAVVSALRQRERTGRGSATLIALADVAVSVLASLGFVDEQERAEQPRVRDGNYLYGAFGRDFTLSDGSRVMLVALTARQWRALVAAFGIAEEVEALERDRGLDLSDEGDRYRARAEIARLLERRCACLEPAAVLEALERHEACWSRYETAPELARALLGTRPPDGEGLVRDVPLPLRLDGTEPSPVGAAPELGRDTEAVLADLLSLSAREIGRLRDAGIAGTGRP